MRRVLARLPWLCLAALLGACAGPPSSTPTPGPPTQEVVTTRLTALLTGQLVMDGNCLRVNGAPGLSNYLLVWPPTIIYSVDAQTVQATDVLLNRQIAWRLGDTIQVGGGEFIPQNDPAQPLPTGCPGPYWLVGGWLDPTATPPPVATPPDLLLLYSSAPGRFEVQMPVALSLREMTSTVTLLNQPIPCATIVAQDYGALWIVQYCDYPPAVISQTTTAALLDAAQELTLSPHAHKLTGQHDVSLNSLYPGRAITAAIDMRNTNGPFDGLLQARLFVAQNRVYTVAAEVYTETADTRLSLVDPFLASFTIDAN